MPEGNKEVKFTVLIDEPMFRRLIGLIDELNKKSTDLVANLTRAGQAMGGGGFAGAVPPVGGGSPSTSPGASAGLAGGQPGGQSVQGGGLFGGLTNSVTQLRTAMEGLDKGSKTVMRALSDAVEDSVGRSKRKVDDLKASIEDLARQRVELREVFEAGHISPKQYDESNREIGGKLIRTRYEQVRTEKEVREVEGALRSATGGGKDGGGSGFAGVLGSGAGGGAGVATFIAAPSLANLMKAGGVPIATALAVAGGAVVGGALAKNYLAATARESLLAPVDWANVREAFGEVRGRGDQMLRGDAASAYALYSTLTSSKGRDTIEALTGEGGMEARRRMAVIQSGGADLSSVLNVAGTYYDIQRSKLMTTPAAVKAIMDMADKEKASDPRFYSMLQERWGGAGRELGLLRGFRMGGVWESPSDRGGTRPLSSDDDIIDPLIRKMERITARGWSPEEVASAQQQLMGIGGQGAGGFAERVVSARYGGLQNAAQLYGTATLLGGALASRTGGDYLGMAGTIAGALAQSGRTGQGYGHGIDPAAASILTEALVSGAMSGTGLTNTAGFAGALTYMAEGANRGEDVYNARIIAQGVGLYGRKLSGAVDPLQLALSTRAGIVAGQGLGAYGQQVLGTGIDPRQEADVLAGGAVPHSLAMWGITREMMQTAHRERQTFAFARFANAAEPTSEVGNFARSVMGFGGDPIAYIKSMAGGDKKRMKELAEVAAGIDAASNVSPSQEAALGDIYYQLGIGEHAKKHGWISDPVSKDAPGMHKFVQEAKRLADYERRYEEEIFKKGGGDPKVIAEIVKGMGETLEKQAAIDPLGADLNRAKIQFISALDQSTDAIRKAFGISEKHIPLDIPSRVRRPVTSSQRHSDKEDLIRKEIGQ